MWYVKGSQVYKLNNTIGPCLVALNLITAALVLFALLHDVSQQFFPIRAQPAAIMI